uniref:HORMA domain-containing protein n=1 Tax=Syphacia muris TaxID=451379 RepID=A0A158R639_9BILA
MTRVEIDILRRKSKLGRRIEDIMFSLNEAIEKLVIKSKNSKRNEILEVYDFEVIYKDGCAEVYLKRTNDDEPLEAEDQQKSNSESFLRNTIGKFFHQLRSFLEVLAPLPPMKLTFKLLYYPCAPRDYEPKYFGPSCDLKIFHYVNRKGIFATVETQYHGLNLKFGFFHVGKQLDNLSNDSNARKRSISSASDFSSSSEKKKKVENALPVVDEARLNKEKSQEEINEVENELQENASDGTSINDDSDEPKEVPLLVSSSDESASGNSELIEENSSSFDRNFEKKLESLVIDDAPVVKLSDAEATEELGVTKTIECSLEEGLTNIKTDFEKPQVILKSRNDLLDKLGCAKLGNQQVLASTVYAEQGSSTVLSNLSEVDNVSTTEANQRLIEQNKEDGNDKTVASIYKDDFKSLERPIDANELFQSQLSSRSDGFGDTNTGKGRVFVMETPFSDSDPE